MDNFIILAKSKRKLGKRTIQFLKIAKKHNLCFKQLKYDFDAKKILIFKSCYDLSSIYPSLLVYMYILTYPKVITKFF